MSFNKLIKVTWWLIAKLNIEVSFFFYSSVVINDSRKFVRKNVDKLRNTGQEIFQIMNELAMQENQG